MNTAMHARTGGSFYALTDKAAIKAAYTGTGLAGRGTKFAQAGFKKDTEDKLRAGAYCAHVTSEITANNDAGIKGKGAFKKFMDLEKQQMTQKLKATAPNGSGDADPTNDVYQAADALTKAQMGDYCENAADWMRDYKAACADKLADGTTANPKKDTWECDKAFAIRKADTAVKFAHATAWTSASSSDPSYRWWGLSQTNKDSKQITRANSNLNNTLVKLYVGRMNTYYG